MNPQPQVIIFQIQQNLKSRLFVTAFYEALFFNIPCENTKYLPYHRITCNILWSLLFCISSNILLIPTPVFFIQKYIISFIYVYFFSVTTHTLTQLVLVVSFWFLKMFLILLIHIPASRFWATKQLPTASISKFEKYNHHI